MRVREIKYNMTRIKKSLPTLFILLHSTFIFFLYICKKSCHSRNEKSQCAANELVKALELNK